MEEPELLKTFQDKCLKCQEEFQKRHRIEARTFPYSRCKRCDIGRQMHELGDPRWLADYVKSEE